MSNTYACKCNTLILMRSPCSGKESTYNAADKMTQVQSWGLEDSPRGGYGNPLQYSPWTHTPWTEGPHGL